MPDIQKTLLDIFGGGLATKKLKDSIHEITGANGVTAHSLRDKTPYSWTFDVPDVRRLPYTPHPAGALLVSIGVRRISLLQSSYKTLDAVLVDEIDRFVAATHANIEMVPLFAAAVVDPEVVDEPQPEEPEPAPQMPDMPPVTNVHQNPMLPMPVAAPAITTFVTALAALVSDSLLVEKIMTIVRQYVAYIDFWERPNLHTQLRATIKIMMDDADLLPFGQLDALADRIMQALMQHKSEFDSAPAPAPALAPKSDSPFMAIFGGEIVDHRKLTPIETIITGKNDVTAERTTHINRRGIPHTRWVFHLPLQSPDLPVIQGALRKCGVSYLLVEKLWLIDEPPYLPAFEEFEKNLPLTAPMPTPAPATTVAAEPEPAVNFNQIAINLISTLGDNTLKFHCMESGKYWETSIEKGVATYHISMWPVNDTYPIGKSSHKSHGLILSWLEGLTITTEPRLVPPVLPAAPAPAPAPNPEPVPAPNPEPVPAPQASAPDPDETHRAVVLVLLGMLVGKTGHWVEFIASEKALSFQFLCRPAVGGLVEVVATSRTWGSTAARTMKTTAEYKLWLQSLNKLGEPFINPPLNDSTPTVPAVPAVSAPEMPAFPPSDAEWHIVAISGNYGKQKVVDPQSGKQISAYKTSYTGAASIVIRRLYDGYTRDVTPKRAAYHYIHFDKDCETLTHRDCFLVEISSKTLAEIAEITRQYDRSKTYVWRDKKWWELPSQQSKEFTLVPRMNFDPEPLHPPRPGEQQKKEERMSGLKAEKKGSMWWISGDTYPHRHEIKAAGCRWNRQAQAWTYSGEHLPAALATLVEANKPAPAPSMPPELSKMIEGALAADDARDAAARTTSLMEIFGGKILDKHFYDDDMSFIHLSGSNMVFASQAIDPDTGAIKWYFDNTINEPAIFNAAITALKAHKAKWLPTSFKWVIEDEQIVIALNMLAASIPVAPYHKGPVQPSSSLLKIFGGKLVAKRMGTEGVIVMGENGCFARRLGVPPDSERWVFDLPSGEDAEKAVAAIIDNGATYEDGHWRFKTVHAVSRMNAVAEFIPFDTLTTWVGLTREHAKAQIAAQSNPLAAPVPQPEPTPAPEPVVAPPVAPKPEPVAAPPVAPEPEPEPEKEPPIKIIAPPSMDGKDEVTAAIRAARLSPPTTAPALPVPKAGHVAVKQTYVGELTGSVSGNVYCYGYAVYKGIAIYINLAGPKVAVEAIRAKLGKGEIVNCVSDDAPTQELTAGEKNTGKYKAYSTWMQEARFMSEILVHENAVTPNYGGLSTTFIIRTDDAQAIAKLKHHIKQLVKIPVFDEWGDYLYQSGQTAMLMQPCKCAGGIDMLAVTLDVDAWTRLITGGLAQNVITLPVA